MRQQKSCAEWEELLAVDYPEDDLLPAEYVALQEHLAECINCRTLHEKYVSMVAHIRMLEGNLPVCVAREKISQQRAQQSLLSVPYQNGATLQQAYQPAIPMQAMPYREKLLPTIPDKQGGVYIPPIYTKPQAIIPRYRAMSGLLSILIISLLLCAGGGYYAQASGKFDALKRFYRAAAPISLQRPTGQQLPNPPNKVDMGPAANIIPSAATTSSIDPKTNIPLQAQNTFKAGVPFYVAYTVKPDKVGTVMVKWYMNNLYFGTAQSKPIDPKATPTANGYALIVFAQPAEGKVELYWNGRLAQRLYFVVR